ncbi:hypothetical protein AtDm6_0764 [Acetobacter tropicalis]|uniref:Uncharacterized protein n=1 Tax=Acetobacter tropicalis TaxID=104102 RepID=A0A094YXY9_9PROT|nr:hypothetical protein AtDm6_0764 [Acetobacter tropicalis]
MDGGQERPLWLDNGMENERDEYFITGKEYLCSFLNAGRDCLF